MEEFSSSWIEVLPENVKVSRFGMRLLRLMDVLEDLREIEKSIAMILKLSRVQHRCHSVEELKALSC